MSIFNNIANAFRNSTNIEDSSVKLDDVLLQALINGETITRDKALTIPAVAGAEIGRASCRERV